MSEGSSGDAELELPSYQVRQCHQGLALHLVENFGLMVDHAQGSEHASRSGDQGRPCVETDPRVAKHQGVRGEPWILQSVLDDEELVGLQEGMCAEGVRSRRLLDV